MVLHLAAGDVPLVARNLGLLSGMTVFYWEVVVTS